jgi:hypothetical protein
VRACLSRRPMEIQRREFAALVIGAATGLSAAGTASAQNDPLPSWNDGPTKDAILKFVRATTDPSSPGFVPPEDRVAEFDQDDMFWVEQPVYTQVVFCLDRVPALVKERPELKGREPFKAILSGNRDALAKLSMRGILEVVVGTQSGMTVEEFRAEVGKWLAMAEHPRWVRPYTELVYQPMLEVLSLLRADGFMNFIATGGSANFVREYSGKVYDIPAERVAGMSQGSVFGHSPDSKPGLTQEPKLVLNNLEAGKIENFWLMYGRRPYIAFGNSSSDDQQMLEYVKAGSGAWLSAAALHDDAVREYAYGPAQDCRTQVSGLSARRCTTWA